MLVRAKYRKYDKFAASAGCANGKSFSLVETDRISFSFSFSAPKMPVFDGFGNFRFRPKTQ